MFENYYKEKKWKYLIPIYGLFQIKNGEIKEKPKWYSLNAFISIIIIFLLFGNDKKNPEMDKQLLNDNKNIEEKSKQVELKDSKLKESKLKELNANEISALKEIRGEKKVLKAEIRENILYATVKDDGTNRKGYAEYLCQTLKEHSLNSMTVKVIDNKNNILGESNCNW